MSVIGLRRVSTSAVCYRFAGVELNAVSQRVLIDGKVRTCSRKTFELLHLMCANPGRVLSRDEITSDLWPGGQIVSDESLTQVIFRLRSILGPYSTYVRTVRGIGLALDVTVQQLPADAANKHSTETSRENRTVEAEVRRSATSLVRKGPEAGPTQIPSLTQPALASVPKRRYNWSIALLLVAVGLVALVLFESRPVPSSALEFINDGYGLQFSDLKAGRDDTAQLLIESFKNEAAGERARSMELLEAVHRSDTSTPIPAIFLALWNAGTGNHAASQDWLVQAGERMGGSTDAYLNLLIDYVQAENGGTPEQIINRAGAILDIRPEAWRMHAARADLMEFIGMRAAALREVQQIEVTEFGHRKRSLIIAARASFGDVEGAQAMLSRIPPETDPSTHAWLSGRVAWSSGDFQAAYEHFRRASHLAYDVARVDIYTRSLIYAGAIEVMLGQDDAAVATLLQARSAVEGIWFIDEVDLSLLLAELHAEAGRMDEMHIELERAVQGSMRTSADNVQLATLLAVWRLQPETEPVMPVGLSVEFAALWRAMEAYAHGRLEDARRNVTEARINGVCHTRLDDEARWLEWRLGEPIAPESVIDPPYPPISRVILRREIRRGLLEHGPESGQARP